MTTWQGCYDGNWNDMIVPESFAHPAKYARNLIERIYLYLIHERHLRAGDVVVDPFGGIGTGGIIGAYHGIQWLGCELEPKFVALGKCNFKLHSAKWKYMGVPMPKIVRGDSRKLRKSLGKALADCVVSSPPYAEAIQSKDNGGLMGGTFRLGRGAMAENSDGYGSSPGQLGAMPSGNVDAVVSSQPYEEGLGHGGTKELPILIEKKLHSGLANNGYGGGPGNISNLVGETFWTAARLIVLECEAILRPGGVAVWVCKDFVRKGKRVPFSDDWQRLCEACGFVMVERIQASLVKEDSHPSLFGGMDTKLTERKSFFRRMAEKKGSPRIDHEDVIVMRKASGGMVGSIEDAI